MSRTADVIPIDARARGSVPDSRVRCSATTSSGRPCRNYALEGIDYCRLHADGSARRQHPSADRSRGNRVGAAQSSSAWERAAEFVRRRTSGDYPIDDFGFDKELFEGVFMPLARPLYERYFRVRTLGVDRIPDTGPALVVANHSGTVPLDAVMMQYAVWAEHPQRRVVRNVAANLAMAMPFVGPIARKGGNAVACEEDARELLTRGELVGVFPEGYKGVGKGWRERYRLQRFGRGGFVETSLRARVPIVPVAIVGAEEAYPMVGNARLLARILRFPYFPITPTFPALGPLGAIPLPSRWIIEFGDPIPMDEYPEDAAEDPMLVFDLNDRIRDTIQQMLYRNLRVRGRAFF